MFTMATIRVDDTTARELRKWGDSYNDSVKALLEKKQIDYDYIRQIIEDCFIKHMTK